VLYRHANAHGDTVTTTGASGERVWAGHHGPYGETPTPEPADGTTTVPNTSWGWHGHQARLTDNNLIHMGARPYHPTLGRFLQVDPIEGGCANDYTYVRGDPMNESDVSGLAGCPGWLVRGARIVGVGDWIRAGFEVALGDTGRGAQDLSNRYAEKVATDGVKQGWTGLLGSRFGSVASHVVKGLGLVRAFPVVAGATFIDAWCQRSGSDDPVVR
jgi:RHS repeat-associated protein